MSDDDDYYDYLKDLLHKQYSTRILLWSFAYDVASFANKLDSSCHYAALATPIE